jgi:plasmid stabilization system protein ParE
MGIAKFSKHLIFYHIEDGQVVILRVLHGARDLENLF